jgi:hypothetical protein
VIQTSAWPPGLNCQPFGQLDDVIDNWTDDPLAAPQHGHDAGRDLREEAAGSSVDTPGLRSGDLAVDE